MPAIATTECWVFVEEDLNWLLFDNGPIVAKDRASAKEVLAVCKKIGFCPESASIIGWLCGDSSDYEDGSEWIEGLGTFSKN